MQGWRCSMEDSHISEEMTLPNGDMGAVFGVFDGHGGSEVAAYIKENFMKVFTATSEFKQMNYEGALDSTFMKLDDKVQEEDYAQDTGSTICVVFISKDNIYCSNSGDSRAILVKKGGVVEPLSEDHKPDNTNEEKRINAANHFVSDQRVDGNLALSRAIGDFQYKDMPTLAPKDQAVTAKPEIKVVKRTKDDEFIVNACDGIWDCLSNEQCAEKMAQKIKEKKKADPAALVGDMLDDILAKDTEDGIGTDNMTAILIKITSTD